MSLTPLHLQNAFANITKSRIPEAVMRGRQFEAAITHLAEWWTSVFAIESTGHIRNRTFADVQKTVVVDPKGKGKAREMNTELADEDAEIIRSEKSLMKHALQWKGSRDVSAQLFTALCRALGVPARLVVSLQSVPWQAGADQPNTAVKKTTKSSSGAGKGKGKGKATASDVDEAQSDADDDDDMEEVDIPDQSFEMKNVEIEQAFLGDGYRLDGNPPAASKSPGKQKAPPAIRLRKYKGRKLGTATSEQRSPSKQCQL